MANWKSAKKGVSGLWFKGGKDGQRRRHLLISEDRHGVDDTKNGSHDHFWEDGKGGYMVQLKDGTGTATMADKKGHIYPSNTSFNGLANKELKMLMDDYC